jgi:hypothetical protein
MNNIARLIISIIIPFAAGGMAAGTVYQRGEFCNAAQLYDLEIEQLRLLPFSL